MKNRYPFTLMIALILVSACASYTSTNNHLDSVLSKTEQAMIGLADKVNNTDDQELKKTYTQLEQKRKELFPLLIKCNEKYALTKAYMATLKEAQKTVQRLEKNFDTASDKVFMLNAIYLDYDAKIQSIQNSPKNEANTTIKVVVNSNQEEGFFVFGKLSYEKELDIKRFRFNQPTQNAVQDFVPGYYLFWLEKEDRVSEPELHLIISDGSADGKQLVLKTPKS